MPMVKNLVFDDQTGDKVSEFLRPRLRDACLALLTVWLLALVMQIPFPRLAAGWATNLALTLALLVQLPMLLLLRSGLTLSLRQLRWLEAGLFVLGCGVLGIVQINWLDRVGDISQAEPGSAPTFIADSLGLPWFMLIVVYGTYIPNSWQRTLGVTLTMTALPLRLTIVYLPAGASVRGELLPGLLLDLLAAVVIAVYGSIYVGGLRREALDARLLGQYRLKDKLGQGGMGEVYLAEHQLLRRPCAVKVIRAEARGDERQIARFEREVQATCTLMHANTVRVYDYGITPDRTFYYVMEYLHGFNLQELVEHHGPLPPERAVHLLRQVCGALHEAHQGGLIHRDIKPSNIMVCEQGFQYDVAKLTDFGLVYIPDEGEAELTGARKRVGTPFFMSPEQLSGQPIDARSDIYSLGVVAYFLLAGLNPFARDQLAAVIAAHLAEPVPPLIDVNSDVEVDLHAVVMRCLEKAPGERFADARSLQRALSQCDCARLWTRERAESWWRAHPRPVGVPVTH